MGHSRKLSPDRSLFGSMGHRRKRLPSLRGSFCMLKSRRASGDGTSTESRCKYSAGADVNGFWGRICVCASSGRADYRPHEDRDRLVDPVSRLVPSETQASGSTAPCHPCATDVLPHRCPMDAEPLGDRQYALAAHPSGSNSFHFLLRQNASIRSTGVLDDVEAFGEREWRRRLEGRRSLDPRGIKAIQPTHKVQAGYPRDHKMTSAPAFGGPEVIS